MFNNIVIIHGIGGLKRESYFPHLKAFCEEIGLKVFMPELGGYKDGISYQSWAKYFDENVLDELSEKTIVVAQSIGTQFIVKYLADKNINIGVYISCAGPKDILDIKEGEREHANTFSPISKLFKPTDEEFEKFKQFNFLKFSFYSDNDKSFCQKNLEAYAESIGSKKIFVQGKNHFNFDAEVFEFNELEDLIKKLVTK